jgi:hypothetical protein
LRGAARNQARRLPHARTDRPLSTAGRITGLDSAPEVGSHTAQCEACHSLTRGVRWSELASKKNRHAGSNGPRPGGSISIWANAAL